MPIHPISAAKRLCARSGGSLSNLQLQKILYIAHMNFWGTRKKPLIEGHFQAWNPGPVHPDIYHYVKMFGAEPIGNFFRSKPDVEAGEERDFLDQAFDRLKDYSSASLVGFTHEEDGGGGAGTSSQDR